MEEEVVKRRYEVSWQRCQADGSRLEDFCLNTNAHGVKWFIKILQKN